MDGLLGQSTGWVETNPLVLDGINGIILRSPAEIFFAGYLRLDMNYPMKLLVYTMKYPMLYPRELRHWNPVFSLVKSQDFLWFPVFSIISLFYHEYITIITFVSWYDDIYIYINNYILELSENHHTIFYNSYITISIV